MAISVARLRVLASQRSLSRRHKLLRALAESFLGRGQRLSAEECALFDEIGERVLGSAEPAAREELAERLRNRADAPPRMVARLAADIISVAAPVLSDSPVLREETLATLAQQKSQEHLLVIAKRERVSERVSDILIDRGDPLVLDAIASNLGARFSAAGAAALIDLAIMRDSLWRRLVERTALPQHLARLSPATADSISADTVLKKVCSDRLQFSALPSEIREILIAGLHSAAVCGPALDKLRELIAAGQVRFLDAVTELADVDQIADLAGLIGEAGGVKREVFMCQLTAPDEKPLIATCHAAGLDLETFSAVLRVRRRRRPFSTAEISRLLRAYHANAPADKINEFTHRNHIGWG